MNFRKLITYLTMGTAAAMPLAVAQNPTILQGNYITNVFGNSNFVLNPNAQTNVANVTVSSATVTRSTTTPLVATSEFTITTSTATGYADWSLRSFDQGMKNQNCEARFTYRGFTVGSTKAQILQGANVVAELTLVGDANNPKQASINFPCGDLSAVTKFRLQQATASLTGTNEIGGIYVGLATNMANVAQAETVVLAGRSTTQTIANNTQTTIDYATETLDVYGEYTSGVFTAKRAGNYVFDAMFLFNIASWTTNQLYEISAFKNGSQSCTNNQNVQATLTTYIGTSVSCGFTLAVGDTIEIKVRHQRGSNTDILNDVIYTRLQVKRFPSSSELVVTPERQNVFGGVKAYGNSNTNTVSTLNTWTKLTSLTTLTRTVFGKADTAATNDLSITVNNMPVGTFLITASAPFHASSSAAGDNTNCFFGIADTATGGAQIGAIQVSVNGDASTPAQNSLGGTISGLYTNSSVANKTFFVQAFKVSGSGNCFAYLGLERPLTISIVPVDQPSNSALYVQGPVKAAVSNTAIPTDSIGGKVIDSSISFTTTSLSTWQVGSGNFGTPPAGSYLIFLRAEGSTAAGLTGFGGVIGESGSSVTPVICQTQGTPSSSVTAYSTNTCYWTTDGSKTLYPWYYATGANTTILNKAVLVRLN